MATHHESLRERTQNNENLTAPDPHPAGVRGNHSDLHDRTMNNENLTASIPDVASTMSPPLEKDFSYSNNSVSTHVPPFPVDPQAGPYSNGYHQHLDNGHDSETALRKIRTAGSISISPDLFEKLYLSPQNKVKGDLRKTFGNPTPLALVGFLISLTPLSIALMGWRGAGGNGAAGTGTYYFFGGLLMTLGSLGEFIIGNTFPFVVFGSFGAFWLGWAATLQPFYNAYGAYSTTDNPADGLETIGFRGSYGFFFIAMGILCFVYLICSLRTNICFFLIFLTLVIAFCLLAAAYWHANNGNVSLSQNCQIAAGAVAFVTCMIGWWIFMAIMLASLDFPFSLPVGDLSNVIKGASQKKADENV